MGTFFTWLRQTCARTVVVKLCLSPSARRGLLAEWRACLYLWRRGLRLLRWRYRCRRGELDLIMREGDVIVFVEVRYRSSDRYGGALGSVNRKKRDRVRRSAAHYLRYHDPESRYCVRFDVVAIQRGQAPHWVQGAFTDAG